MEFMAARSLQLIDREPNIGRIRRTSSEVFAADNKPSFKSGSNSRRNTSRLSHLRKDTVLPKHLYKPTSNKIDTSICKLSEYQINKMIEHPIEMIYH